MIGQAFRWLIVSVISQDGTSTAEEGAAGWGGGTCMRYVIEDRRYRFRSAFDMETGAYVRTGILDDEGRDTGVDPFMASFPHLIDVGVMGSCIHGKTGLCVKAGIGCYQSGSRWSSRT